MLYIISKSLFSNNVAKVNIPLITTEDAILLIGDGVYGTTHPILSTLTPIFAIEDDCKTRGVAKEPHIHYIDYADMVRLTEQHNPIVTW